MTADDPLSGAEREMNDYKLEVLTELFKKVESRLGYDPSTNAEIAEALHLIANDPDLQELWERVEALDNFGGA